MATFAASFTVSQSIDGKTLTITDTSNYGADSSHNKTNFLNRQLIVIRGDNVNASTTYPWPYTNTDNSIQDTMTIGVDGDYAYSMTLQLTYEDSSLITATNPVLTSQFVTLNKIAMLALVQPCDCNDSSLIEAIGRVAASVDASIQRASTGDISGAEQLIQFAYDETLIYVNPNT
jgi:hypothetical protein